VFKMQDLFTLPDVEFEIEICFFYKILDIVVTVNVKKIQSL
jgi:hypothetical protein